MTIQLNLPLEMERQLVAQATHARQDVSEFVRQIVADRLLETTESPAQRPVAEVMSAIREIVDRHPGFGGQVDDSRDSIYAGRGE